MYSIYIHKKYIYIFANCLLDIYTEMVDKIGGVYIDAVVFAFILVYIIRFLYLWIHPHFMFKEDKQQNTKPIAWFYVRINNKYRILDNKLMVFLKLVSVYYTYIILTKYFYKLF